jgi:myosin heavy subunit
MKELLEKLANGETTVDDVLKAIDEVDKDKVPRSRLNDKIEDIKELQQQLSDRDKQLKDLKKTAEGNEDLQEQIKKLQDDNKKVKEDYENRLAEKTFDFSLEKALSDAKAKNPRAVKALLNREAIKLDGDKLLGLEEQLKSLQESDGYLFGDNEPAGLKGRQAHPPAQNQQKELTKEQFNQLDYQGRTKIYHENPDLYKQLSE